MELYTELTRLRFLVVSFGSMVVWCHGVVDSTCDTEYGGTGSIPSHVTKVNSAFHPFEVDKLVPACWGKWS